MCDEAQFFTFEDYKALMAEIDEASRRDAREIHQEEVRERCRLRQSITIVHVGWFQFEVRQGRRYIGTRSTFRGAMKLAEEAGGLV